MRSTTHFFLKLNTDGLAFRLYLADLQLNQSCLEKLIKPLLGAPSVFLGSIQIPDLKWE